MNKCPICNSENVIYIYFKKVKYCKLCNFGFNELIKNVNYKDTTSFSIENDFLLYEKFAERDFNLIQKCVNLNNISSILEIGPGLGLLARKIIHHNNSIDYDFIELNDYLSDNLIKDGFSRIESLNFNNKYDLVILNHSLEHIKDFKSIIENLSHKCDGFIFLQCNVNGFFPRFLPFLWYGWSLDQHYYHFSINSLLTLLQSKNFKIYYSEYYKLNQVINFSLKGIVKFFLRVINILITKENSDAFIVYFKKND